MVNWDDEDIKEWKEDAIKRQQHYCESLGDRNYDHFSSDQITYLEVKIAYAYFGAPNVDENENTDTEMLSIDNYNEEQKGFIKKISSKILEVIGSQDINVAFLFVVIKQHKNVFQLPLIKLEKTDGKVCFLDNFVRVYNGWDDYVNNNELPKCICCYPKNGIYEASEDGNVRVQVTTSPRCNVGEQLVNAADITSTVATFASLGLLGASFFLPVLAPVAAYTGASACGYGVVRSSYRIYDRSIHDQSINPIADGTARSIWLGAVGGALGLGSMGVTSYISKLAVRGDIARKFIRVTYTVLGAGSLTVNGLGVVSNIIELAEKKIKGEEVTKMEVFNFGLSVFFFTNACLKFKTAKSLIRDVQIDVIDNYGKNLPEETSETFKRFRDKAVLNTKVRPNARFIKSINQINNPEEFWRCLASAGDAHNIKFHRKNFGQVIINKELVIHANKLVEMNLDNPTVVDEIFQFTNKLMSDPSYAPQFLDDVKGIVKKERINFEITRRQTLEKLRKTLGVQDLKDYKVGGESIFHNMEPHSIDRIGNVMEQCKVFGDEELLQAVKSFAEKTNCKNASDFIAGIEILTRFKAAEAKKTFFKNPRKQRSALVVKELNKPNSDLMKQFCSEYDKVFSKVSQVNAMADQPFKTDNLATYHFMKHGDKKTPEEYFDQIKVLFNAKCQISDWKHTQDGQNMICKCYTDNGMFGVFIKPIVQMYNACVFTATVFYMKSLDKKIN